MDNDNYNKFATGDVAVFGPSNHSRAIKTIIMGFIAAGMVISLGLAYVDNINLSNAGVRHQQMASLENHDIIDVKEQVENIKNSGKTPCFYNTETEIYIAHFWQFGTISNYVSIRTIACSEVESFNQSVYSDVETYKKELTAFYNASYRSKTFQPDAVQHLAVDLAILSLQLGTVNEQGRKRTERDLIHTKSFEEAVEMAGHLNNLSIQTLK